MQRLRKELVCNTIAEKVDVLGIQEHRMLHTKDIKYETVNGRTLITSSATATKRIENWFQHFKNHR